MNQYLILFTISSFIFIWLFILTLLFIKILKHYHRLLDNTNNKNLQEVLENILNNQKRLERNLTENKISLSKLDQKSHNFLQHISFSRFNPFSDTGGDQSFVYTILNNKLDGMVFTFLHSRDTTRVYAKEIKKGKSEQFPLSKEEEKVIAQAVSSKL